MLVITLEVDVPEALSLAYKERIAMDFEKYGTVRVINIEEKESNYVGGESRIVQSRRGRQCRAVL